MVAIMSGLLQRRAHFASAVVWLCAVLLLTGCRSSAWNEWNPTPVTPDPAVITVQPQSHVVRPGQSATFTVTATSDHPMTYQWNENGIAIPGATGSSYTTPPAVLGANGSTLVGTFTVIIVDSITYVSSQPATLQIGPRPPASGDLRYLLMQQVPSSDLGAYAPIQFVGGESAYNALGSGLSMGSSVECYPNIPGDCGWDASDQFLITPTGYSMHYLAQGYLYSTFASNLESSAAPDLVFTSLDIEPSNFEYAVSWVQTTQPGGFDCRLDPIVPSGTGQQSQIQAQASLDGTQSRIVTAVSFDTEGGANLISYGWQGDTTTVYEALTTLVPPVNNVVAAVTTAATTLASQGYFISAFGGDDIQGYILVGMRVQGDSYPRPIWFQSFLGGSTTATNSTSANFTVVAWLQETGNDVFIYEQ